MLNLTRGAIAAALLGGCLIGHAATQSIYTCTDSKGNVLTSDRLIAACMDRTQTVFGPGGTVLRTIGPSLTGPERAAQEAQQKRAQEELNRQLEEKRRDRALLVRYPNKSVHEQERAAALAQVDDVIRAARKRVTELQVERQNIDTEFEFYKNDPTRAPALLKRQADDNARSAAVQNRFIAEQEAEKKRINARFDDELVKLKQLWALQAPPATAR